MNNQNSSITTAKKKLILAAHQRDDRNVLQLQAAAAAELLWLFTASLSSNDLFSSPETLTLLATNSSSFYLFSLGQTIINKHTSKFFPHAHTHLRVAANYLLSSTSHHSLINLIHESFVFTFPRFKKEKKHKRGSRMRNKNTETYSHRIFFSLSLPRQMNAAQRGASSDTYTICSSTFGTQEHTPQPVCSTLSENQPCLSLSFSMSPSLIPPLLFPAPPPPPPSLPCAAASVFPVLSLSG